MPFQDTTKLVSYLMVPAVCSVSGSKVTPFSEYFEILKTDNAIAHEMNMDASARTLPVSRVNAYLKPEPENVYLGKSWKRWLMGTGIVDCKRDLPTTESERRFVWVKFWFLGFRSDKSLRLEFKWLIVYRRIVKHFPVDGTSMKLMFRQY